MCTKNLACPLCCQSIFPNIDALRLSLLKVTSRPIKCPICADELLGLDKLTIHLFGHSILGKDGENTGKVDKKKGETSALKNCSPKSNGQQQNVSRSQQKQTTQINHTKVRCSLCGDEFRDESLLRMHSCVSHGFPNGANGSTEELRFPCNMCTKSFKMKGSLKIHMRVVHLGCPKKSPSNTSCTSSSSSTTVTTTTTVPVRHNNTVRSTPPSPLQSATSLTITTPNKGSNSSESYPSQSSQPSTPQSMLNSFPRDKQWECDVCLKSFTTKYFLKKHKRLHTGEMPYSCQICGKAFTFQQSYHKHLLYHSDEKPHSCGVCGRAFKELSTLHNHERIHSGEKPFSCETCGKCFRQRVSYLVHRRIHTNTQPYKCTACNKSFRYKVSQRTHKCPAQ
ncbi:AAEL001349-PA, partial [Aedes aegypti]